MIACFYTLYLALHNPLSMVQDDYYKEGLAINRNLAADQQAVNFGLQADITPLPQQQIQLQLTAKLANVVLHTGALTLRLSHPVNQNKDLLLKLTAQPNSSYLSDILNNKQWTLLLNEKRWYLTLIHNKTDEQPAWSLRGEHALQLTQTTVLAAQHD